VNRAKDLKMLSRQKLALFGLAVAAGLVALGRWGMTTVPLREQDVAAVFGGGFVAGLAVVRFLKNWREVAPKPAADPGAAPPKSKS
jgi:hypothetical protein